MGNLSNMSNMSSIPFADEYEKLKLLISQGQFELLFPESESQSCIRLVYLMNDAVESFLVFHEAVLTGEYQPDFQGELQGILERNGDRSLIRWLAVYARFPRKVIAKQIARLLHTVRHAEVVDLIEQRLSHAAGIYQDRVFEEAEEIRIQKIKEKAELRKIELEQSGKRVEMLKEEPFLYAKDSVEYKIHLMVWKTEGKNRQVDVETIG